MSSTRYPSRGKGPPVVARASVDWAQAGGALHTVNREGPRRKLPGGNLGRRAVLAAARRRQGCDMAAVRGGSCVLERKECRPPGYSFSFGAPKNGIVTSRG